MKSGSAQYRRNLDGTDIKIIAYNEWRPYGIAIQQTGIIPSINSWRLAIITMLFMITGTLIIRRYPLRDIPNLSTARFASSSPGSRSTAR